MHGLTVDHLYAVEVVVVDSAGRVRCVVATREQDAPNRDLWWAHTGGGGGNFGVVTRYWFRSPDARGTDPSRLLPRPPRTVPTFRAPGTDYAALHTNLILLARLMGKPFLIGQVSSTSAPERIMDEHLDAISAGTVAHTKTQVKKEVPGLYAAQVGSGDCAGRVFGKMKSAYAKKRVTDQQIATAHQYLSNQNPADICGAFSLATYGGKVGDVAPDTTAYAHRESLFKIEYVARWPDPAQEAVFEAGLRKFYRAMYADTGGVSVPGEVNDGTYINYPDVGMRDPAWNTSNTPWHHLHYKDNYARLQRVKARFDATYFFRHGLSIEPA
ncbi:BBE domain-containing protein [Streptomyces litchfieldiae]|uniref:BBE domain-containing protein n=1 Tax=Streptomyces litchfieldiae TaxID=3075543 RepID=A0ABU2MS35_9ACTN|nr:BBE domain-containing protein [Streptomyces sp. DSM 44938]MDT0344158.1 BBE domain-containing protein [Streptomyces sp. DSM 44938]